MQETIYFYRKLGSAEFFKASGEKKIIPVRLKSEYTSSNYFFDQDKKAWKEINSIPAESEDSVPAEFVEFPQRPERPDFTGNGVLSARGGIDLEDLAPDEMQNFLDWREKSRRYAFNSRNFKDQNGIKKDLVAAKIFVDDETLVLKITFSSFVRVPMKGDERPIFEEPVLKEQSLSFDMKKGKTSCDFDKNIIEFLEPDEEIKKNWEPWQTYLNVMRFLKELETKVLPSCILAYAHEKLGLLACKYTGLSEPPSSRDSVCGGENTGEPSWLSEIHVITMLPCEPRLYGVLMSEELFKMKFHFRFKRNDTKVLNRFLRKARVKNYRVLRKAFLERPLCLLAYMRLHDAGFKDINLYNRVIESQENCDLINSFDRKPLVFFSKHCIRWRGELCAMNILLKKVYGDDGEEDRFEKIDAMNMFCEYFKYVPKELREDILKDGFTKFNHDALSNISYQAKNKNIEFKYGLEQKKLEDDIDGYSFRLPKNSWQMSEIGTAMRNCVASYAERVQRGECTIVYAENGGECKICIEVRGNEIRQERASRNGRPNEEQMAALAKWHERHGLRDPLVSANARP